jgi:hypothetical protein
VAGVERTPGTTTRLMVAFAGEGSGVDELTWGQREIWRSISTRGTSMIVGGAVRLDEGTTVPDVAMMLRFVMGRHQSLRTRLRFGPDGRPRQEVTDSGEVPLLVVDAGDADPDEVAESVREGFQATDFDYATEWPVRMAVVRRHGAATHMVAAYSHLSIDAHGIAALAADLRTMDPATGRGDRPVTALQPLAQAAQQRSAGAQRHSRQSLRYWERLLRELPPQPVPHSRDGREPRFWQLACTSPAGQLALRRITARDRSHPGPVVLAAFAAAMATVTGRSPVVVQTLVNNRFRPGLAGSVSAQAQPGLCVLEVAGRSFAEVAGHAWRATTRAGKHAYYDPDRLDDLIAAVREERGDDLDISCFYNDRRRAPGMPQGPPPSAEQVLAALPAHTRRWVRRFDTYDRSVFLHVDDVPDALDHLICADTHRLSPSDTEALAGELEAALVRFALDPDARAVDTSSAAEGVVSDSGAWVRAAAPRGRGPG